MESGVAVAVEVAVLVEEAHSAGEKVLWRRCRTGTEERDWARQRLRRPGSVQVLANTIRSTLHRLSDSARCSRLQRTAKRMAEHRWILRCFGQV